jgi:hypothetical protein
MDREIFEVEAPFKFTFPIEKAETRDDGMYLIGVASGPEVDIQNERVHPTLIQKWADQINSGDPDKTVIYRDWHNKNSSAADLGVVTKAWVDDADHLVIEARLDEDNPTAVYIHKSIDKKKKQFGMSVFGKVHSYADEFVKELGRTVRTFYDATLEEVSNTTKPVYTPSFGTVLSKAVDEADAKVGAADGGTRVGDEIKPTETVVEETTEVATATETGAAETTPDVEKAIKTETKRDDAHIAKIVKQFTALGQSLRDAGLIAEDVDSGEETAETVTKSESDATKAETTSAPEVATLAKAVSDLTSIVTDLAGRIPDGSAPGTLVKSEAVDPLAELKAIENPLERLRLGLAAAHGEDQR